MVSQACEVDVDMADEEEFPDDDEEEEIGNDDDDGESEEADDEDDLEVPDDEVEGDEGKEEEGDGAEVKSGWADAMAKVLNTGKTSKSSVALLSKAKKDYERAGAKPKGDDAAAEAAGAAAPAASEEKRESYAAKRARKKEKDAMGRVKPDVVGDRARERLLSKLATKGVVQLFNAVREQQKSLKSQLDVAGRSERKREKVFKNIDREGFLDVLTGGKKARKTKSAAAAGQECKMEMKKEEEEDESTWRILRDDFMMGAKMRDWDKNSDSEG